MIDIACKNINISLVILFVLITVSCGSCSKELIYSQALADNPNLFLLKYKTFSGGVFAGDSYSYYLTDSISLNMFLGETV